MSKTPTISGAVGGPTSTVSSMVNVSVPETSAFWMGALR